MADENTSGPVPARTRDQGVLVLVLALLFFASVLFQSAQLWLEHGKLVETHAGQEVQIKEAQRIREALDSLAANTAKLADRGNANAYLVVTELARRGITIKYAEGQR